MATGRLPAYLDRGADPQILSRGAARWLGAATPGTAGLARRFRLPRCYPRAVSPGTT